MKDRIMERMKSVFRPEFLNRLDEIIVFHSLNEDELGQIVELLVDQVKARINEQGLELELTENAKKQIIKEGYDPAFGARPLKRAIQRTIEDKVSEEILKGNIKTGDKVLVDIEEDHVVVRKNEKG